MKYQLVLQFSPKYMDLDKLVELENILENNLKEDDVDGHDIGQEEMNIFILSNNPKKCFELVFPLISADIQKDMKAAFREITKDEFTVLYPKGLKDFDVL